MANAGVVNDALGTRKQQALLCFALFAIAYSAQAVSPVMLFYTVNLKLTTTMLTLFFTVYAVGLMIAFLIGGPQSDKRGRKSVVVPSMGLLALAILALLGAAVWGEPMILVARFVQGVASGAVFTVGTVWLRELAGTKHAASAAMRASGVMAFGFGVGPFVSGIFVEWLPWPRILTFVIALVLVVIAIVIARRLPETMTEHRPGRIQIGLPKGTVAGYLGYLLPCGLLVYSFAMLSVIAFPIQLGNAGFTQIYFILGVSAGLVQIAAAVATIWAKRLGPAQAGWLAGLCGAAGCAIGFVAVQPGNWAWVIPASILLGLGGGLAMTSGVTMSDMLAPPDRRGGLISMFYIVAYVGYSSSTILSLIWGKDTMNRGGTLIGLGISAAVIMVVLAVAGRAVVPSRGAGEST